MIDAAPHPLPMTLLPLTLVLCNNARMTPRQQLHKTIAQLRRWDTGDLQVLDEALHTLLDERQREDTAPVPLKAGRTVVEERRRGTVTLRLEYVRCGKESCHCATDEGHGPYCYAYYRKAGRLTSQYVGKDVAKFTPG